MIRSAWFCPSCRKHHGPHVDTCPGPVDAGSKTPMPTVKPWVPQEPERWWTAPTTGEPWKPSWFTTCSAAPAFPLAYSMGIAAPAVN